MERKLCAILAADIVGYSALMHQDHISTITALNECRDIIDAIIGDYGGRIMFTAGDSVVAEFPSAGNSALCAQGMQVAINVRNDNPHAGPEMLFRIGLNVGDVVINKHDLLGEGVNIAARLEALADPGGVLLSGSVYDQIAFDPSITGNLTIEAMGLVDLKNIAEPARVYRLIITKPPVTADPKPLVNEANQLEVGALQFDTPDGPVMAVIGGELAIGRMVRGQPIAVGVTHPQVSRIGRQARIDFQEGIFVVTDLDSANGTFLNDDPLVSQQAQKLVYHDGRCKISVGGGREPAQEGHCRFIVDAVEAIDPVLRIALDSDILDEPGFASTAAIWTGLSEEIRRVWVLGAGQILIGSDLDCGISLPGAAQQNSKVAVERLQGRYLLSPFGLGEPLLNGEPLKKHTAARHGDVLVIGEQSITISTLHLAPGP